MKPVMKARTDNPQKEGVGDIVCTPEWLATFMVDLIGDLSIDDDTYILDPCFGNGVLLEAVLQQFGHVEAIRIQGFELRAKSECDHPLLASHYQLDWGTNFFDTEPKQWGASRDYPSVILMNPPWGELGCVKFVEHALDVWAGDYTRILAIQPDYVLNNSERRKHWLRKHLHECWVLPKDTFKPKVPVSHSYLCEYRRTKATQISFGFISKYKDEEKGVIL